MRKGVGLPESEVGARLRTMRSNSSTLTDQLQPGLTNERLELGIAMPEAKACSIRALNRGNPSAELETAGATQFGLPWYLGVKNKSQEKGERSEGGGWKRQESNLPQAAPARLTQCPPSTSYQSPGSRNADPICMGLSGALQTVPPGESVFKLGISAGVVRG